MEKEKIDRQKLNDFLREMVGLPPEPTPLQKFGLALLKVVLTILHAGISGFINMTAFNLLIAVIFSINPINYAGALGLTLATRLFIGFKSIPVTENPTAVKLLSKFAEDVFKFLILFGMIHWINSYL